MFRYIFSILCSLEYRRLVLLSGISLSMQSSFSTVDQLYRFVQSTSKFFAGGFGKPDNLSRLFLMRKFIMDKENCNELLRQCYPQINIKIKENDGTMQILEGNFLSPFACRFPDLVQEPIATARFQIVMPSKWKERPSSALRAMCIHLAGTGDHMCSLAACNYEKPVALIPCLSWSTASCVFTQGVMTSGVAWNTLKNQYFSEEFRQQESLILTALRHDIKSAALELAKTCSVDSVEKVSIVENVAFYNKLKFLIDLVQYYVADKNANQNSVDSEVMQFLRQVLDAFTHLSGFSKPMDPNLIVVVCAEGDAYVPRDKVSSLEEIWPEAQIRYIKNKGHVSSFLFEQAAFRAAIVDALEKMSSKYYTAGLTEKNASSRMP